MVPSGIKIIGRGMRDTLYADLWKFTIFAERVVIDYERTLRDFMYTSIVASR